MTLTTTKKGSVENESKKPEEESKARMNAIRKALNNAVVKLGVEDPVKAELESAIANETLNPNGGTFEVKLKDGKTYTLTYTGAEVKVETKEATDSNVPGKKPEDITDVMDNNVTGTAYVTGSKITYLHGEKYETTGMGELGIGADFTTAPADAVPGSVTTDTSGRITSYKDTAGNIHSFEYDDNVALDDLKPEERTELDKAATKNGWDTEIKNATLTRVKWTVKSPDTETEKTTPIENGETVKLSKNEWSRNDGNDGTFDFTDLKPNGTTYTGMTLENPDAVGTKTYKKTDKDGTVTIITVTTRQLSKDEIQAKFNENMAQANTPWMLTIIPLPTREKMARPTRQATMIRQRS